jgi:hypothetical protein
MGVTAFNQFLHSRRQSERNDMRGDIRCLEGRLWRHDPQDDDPDLETDVGACPDCDGKGCDQDDDLTPKGQEMPELIDESTVMHGAAFIPRVGDRVEFWSDRQTEKGPSSGSVVAVDRARRTATIRHSDHPGEVFEWAKVRVIIYLAQ